MQAIQGIMPPVVKIQQSGPELATSDFVPPLNMKPLPPVIVTEKGESLDEFCARKQPDIFTVIQVLGCWLLVGGTCLAWRCFGLPHACATTWTITDWWSALVALAGWSARRPHARPMLTWTA